MKKHIFIALIITSHVIFNSCNSNPTAPIENIPIGENAYHQINITQTDYQSFDISNNEHFILDSKKISSIILGDKNSGIFSGNDTSQAVYDQAGRNFKLKFYFTHNTDDTTLVYNFSIRYVFTDNTIYDLDTFKVTYKYPYQSTEIFIKWSNILIPPHIDIQSFDLTDSMIYFHPYGCAGMYEYNMKNYLTTLKIDYCGGDYVAASQNYVFCDLYHHQVGRYNLASDSIDLTLNLSPYYQNGISGMDVYENKLYVSIEYENIIILNFDLQSLGTIPNANFYYWLAIKDSIVYSNDWHQIVRYNLATQSNISSIALPTSKSEAISIVGDKMFFTDHKKKIIGYFNLSDL